MRPNGGLLTRCNSGNQSLCGSEEASESHWEKAECLNNWSHHQSILCCQCSPEVPQGSTKGSANIPQSFLHKVLQGSCQHLVFIISLSLILNFPKRFSKNPVMVLLAILQRFSRRPERAGEQFASVQRCTPPIPPRPHFHFLSPPPLQQLFECPSTGSAHCSQYTWEAFYWRPLQTLGQLWHHRRRLGGPASPEGLRTGWWAGRSVCSIASLKAFIFTIQKSTLGFFCCLFVC